MLSNIQHPPITSARSQLHEHGNKGISSILSRFSFSINWEKALVVSHVALIAAGIAYGFFMRLPAIMVGLATYGMFYLLLRGKVQQSQPNSVYELQAKLEAKDRENTDLRKKLKANLANSNLSSEQREQIIEDQKTIEKLNDRIAQLQARYNAKRDALRKEERALKAQVHDWDRRWKDRVGR